MSDCRANKLAISAFFTCTTGMKNENKKNQKKFSENDFYSKAKIFRKNFYKKSRNDSVAAGAAKRGMVYYSTLQPIQAQNGRIAFILPCLFPIICAQ